MDDWFMTTAPYAIPCYKSAFFVLCQRTPYPDDSPLNRPRALNSLSSLLYLHEKTANRQIRRFSLLKLPSLHRRLNARSKRSRFITLVHAATKSCTNFACASEPAYTSATARNWACEPNSRSTRVPVHFAAPVLRSRPSKLSLAADDAFHSMPMSSKFRKKSLLRTPGRDVSTPCCAGPALAPRTRKPPTSTVISGAVKVNNWALSISSASAGTL